MELGWISLLPPFIAIATAFLTKRVISSLFLGTLLSSFVVSDWDMVSGFKKTMLIVWKNSGLQNLESWQSFQNANNLFTLLFILILGLIVALVHYAGGAKAYGNWAVSKIKTKRGGTLSALFLGIIIFIDDYFSALTVGAVMSPVTDKFRISRAKLAYILDSTAAPVVVLAPLSSWVAEIVSQFNISEVDILLKQNSYTIFLKSIAFNSYAWMALVMVFIIAVTKIEYGPMKKHEKYAEKTGNLFCGHQTQEAAHQNIQPRIDGKVIDLILPLSFFIFIVTMGMFYTGGWIPLGGHNDFYTTLQNMKPLKALFCGSLIALAFTLLFFLPRKRLHLKELPLIFWYGIKLMLPCLGILIMAWSIGTVIKEDLRTGHYLASLIGNDFPISSFPAIFFIFACATSFVTGTSWGTIGIMVPIATPLMITTDPSFLIPILAAILSGAVYGDHASPISDTTILSSAGSGCHHMAHVKTQLPYATTVALACFFGFLISGNFISQGFWIASSVNLATSFVLLLIFSYVFSKISSNPN